MFWTASTVQMVAFCNRSCNYLKLNYFYSLSGLQSCNSYVNFLLFNLTKVDHSVFNTVLPHCPDYGVQTVRHYLDWNLLWGVRHPLNLPHKSVGCSNGESSVGNKFWTSLRIDVWIPSTTLKEVLFTTLLNYDTVSFSIWLWCWLLNLTGVTWTGWLSNHMTRWNSILARVVLAFTRVEALWRMWCRWLFITSLISMLNQISPILD